MGADDWIGAEATPEGLTLWEVRAGKVLARHAMAPPRDDPPRAALALALARYLPNAADLPVLACGLPGAAERALPCRPFAAEAVVAEGRVFHLPALVQPKPCVAVSASAALRLAGCLAADPGFDGVICLTGPESIWAEVSAGEVVGVMAALSGAIATAMLASPWYAGQSATVDLGAFDDDLAQALSRPERLGRILAEARALPPPQRRARLYATLIGVELAAARAWWLGRRLQLLGPDASLYSRALAAQGVPATEGDADAALIAGFALAAREVIR